MPTIEQLTTLLAADPDDTFVLYGLAQEHAKNGDHAEAVSFYDRCLAVDPAYCYAYFHKARTQEAAGDMADALATAQAGVTAATKAGDEKALGELQALCDELEP